MRFDKLSKHEGEWKEAAHKADTIISGSEYALHAHEVVASGSAAIDPTSYVHSEALPCGTALDQSTMKHAHEATAPTTAPRFTDKQGQYLAFIWAYTKINRQAPAESDFQRYFGVTAPAVHNMIKTLDKLGLIDRQPGVVRSIQLRVPPQSLPILGIEYCIISRATRHNDPSW